MKLMVIDKFKFLENCVEESDLSKEIAKANIKVLKAFDYRYPKRNHWATDFGRCRKQLWFNWNAEKLQRPIDIVFLDRMKEGKDTEQTVIDKFKVASRYISSDVPITIPRPDKKYIISGKIDLMSVDEKGKPIPVEVKTSKDFGERQSYNMWKRYLPSLEHLAQLMCYMDAIGIHKGELWYININRRIEQTYKVKYSKKFMNMIHKFFDQVEKDIEKDAPPKVDYSKNKYPCRWFSKDPKISKPMGSCQYWDMCWEVDFFD